MEYVPFRHGKKLNAGRNARLTTFPATADVVIIFMCYCLAVLAASITE